MDERVQRHRGRVTWGTLCFGVALLFAIASRCVWIGRPFQNDAGLYVAIGRTVAHGGMLYRDLWDTKLPSVALLTAPLYLAFGGRWWCYVAFSLMLGVCSAIAVARSARRLGGRCAGLAAGLTALVMLNGPMFVGSGFQLETIQTCFALLGASLFIRLATPDLQRSTDRRREAPIALACGVLGGLAAMAKPTGLAATGAAVVVILLGWKTFGGGRAGRAIGAITCGVLLVVSLNVLYAVHAELTPAVPGVLREISRYASGTPWAQTLAPKTFMFLSVILWPIAVAVAAVVAVRPFVKASPAIDDAKLPLSSSFAVPIMAFAPAWLLFELVGVILQKRAYSYHFLPIVPPACLLFGLVMSRVAASLQRCAAIMVAIVPLVVLQTNSALEQLPYVWKKKDPLIDVAAYVRAHTQPDDSVFADPVGGLSVLADRDPGARLGMLIHFVNDDDAPHRFCGELLNDLATRRPAIIALPGKASLDERFKNWEHQPILARNPTRDRAYHEAWDRLLAFVHDRYQFEIDIEGTRIFRRRAAALPATSPLESSAQDG